jgi:hypothetical protein
MVLLESGNNFFHDFRYVSTTTRPFYRIFCVNIDELFPEKKNQKFENFNFSKVMEKKAKHFRSFLEKVSVV